MFDKPDWENTLVDVLALASQLEDEGQYSLAKLTRAAAESLGRRAAYHRGDARHCERNRDF